MKRLTKHVYPELSSENGERFAISSFLRALDDRNTTFHIKEKDPKTLQEASDLYERYQLLLGDSDIDTIRRKPTVKVITSPEDPRSSDVMQKVIMDLTSRVSQLIDLVHRTVPPTPPHQPAATTALAPASAICSQATAAPCPRCKVRGHWASDCLRTKYDLPRTKGCFECEEDNHFRRNCPHLKETFGKRQWAGQHADRRAHGAVPAHLKASTTTRRPLTAAYLRARVDGRLLDCLLDSGTHV